MKRKKDDEKIKGFMFPRLNVNDSEKGGPRAPPRNKMALYEQLTIPSQSYISGGNGAVPLNLSNNCGLNPSASRNQGMDHERRIHLPLYQQPLRPSYSHHELQVRRPEAVNLSNQPAELENTVKPVEEDDLVVPIFSHHEIEQCTGSTQNSGDGERETHWSAYRATILRNSSDNKKANHSGGDLISREHVVNEDRRNLVVSTKSSDILRREKDGLQRGQQHDSCEGYGVNANGIENGVQRIDDDGSLERENVDRGDDVSETSVIDSASALDISADDVVGIIGVKNFWRARTAIANQQRLLAAQVFELHRLMKVQGLIAGSPDLLLEGSAFVDNTPLKGSNVKKYSSEFAVKALRDNNKMKGDSENPKYKPRSTSEKTVPKGPPVSAPVLSPSVNTDPKMNPWGFHQPSSHQWLMPVMCPSEGLVYKPCPTPGLMGPVFGDYGPVAPTPVVGSLMNPAYGVPMGVQFGGQGYFPPYGMPVMSPGMSGLVMDQVNQFSGPDPYGQMGQLAGVSTKSSCNEPIPKNGCTTPKTEKPSRVIRVVPYEPGSTRKSATRIFESIQEERQQYVSN